MDCSTPGFPVLHFFPDLHSNSCSLSQWCYPIISSSAAHFSSCFQSFPASGSFQISWLFTSGGQSIGVSASASALPMNIQDWFPLGLTSLISLQSKGLSRVFSSTTVWKHQFFSAQPSLWSNSLLHSLSLYMRQTDILPQVCPLGGFPSTESFRSSLSGAIIHWLPTAGCCHIPCQWLLSLEIPRAHREFLVKPETWYEGGTVKQKEQV